tara:strand:- start:2567 stop:2806 length:240 start_codon:yes stop_codon:yes gene_type:complete
MAFMRRSEDVTPKELLLFSYWTTILQLLKLGIAWESIMNLTEEEVNIIVGIEMAIQQKEQDEQAKELAKSNMANTMRKF